MIPLHVTRTPLIIAIIAAIVLQPVVISFSSASCNAADNAVVGAVTSGICPGCNQCRVGEFKTKCGCCSKGKSRLDEPRVANESPSQQASGLKGCCSKRNAIQVGTPEAGNKPAEVVTREVSLGRVTELSDATGSSKVAGTCGCRVGQTPMLPSDTHTPEPRQNPAESFVDTIALTHYLANNWQSDQQAEQWDIPVRPDRYAQRFYSVWLN